MKFHEVCGLTIGEDDRFDAFEAVALPPVGLVEDAVDVLVVDGAGHGVVEGD